jgi:beta-lactamase superfamily II metal-dependent hydrolase
VLSHSDQDHINDLREIVTDQNPRIILHPGDDRRGTTLDDVRLAITEERRRGATELSLSETTVEPGRVFPVGAATATFIAGWDNGDKTRVKPGPDDPPFETIGERRNALSIVIRFEYGGHSVLLTGDTIGRKKGESNRACRYAERVMRSRRAAHPIDSDVLIGQHHGGDNSSSNCFIRAVSPQYVVFSAGRGHEHPRQSVADRFVANHVRPEDMLRTDRGDNEGGPEWIYGALAGCEDGPGDDDVDIYLPDDPGQDIRVEYKVASSTC